MAFDLITILGPTATGKTKIAVKLSSDFNGEIISADSRQVYKGMDIGTGKDLIEFKKSNIHYHLISIIEPSEEYNLFAFTKDFENAFRIISEKGKLPIMAGGTGLYLSTILQNYILPEISDESEYDELMSLDIDKLKEQLINLKPRLHNKTDLTDKDRIVKAILIEKSREIHEVNIPKFSSLNIGIQLERDEIKKRITARLKERFKIGMIEEVEKLLRNGISMKKLEYFGLEYKYIGLYLNGKLNYNDMFQKLNSAIHNFAKRQSTWFRKMEREGVKINWFSPDNYSTIKNFVYNQLSDA